MRLTATIIIPAVSAAGQAERCIWGAGGRGIFGKNKNKPKNSFYKTIVLNKCFEQVFCFANDGVLVCEDKRVERWDAAIFRLKELSQRRRGLCRGSRRTGNEMRELGCRLGRVRKVLMEIP